MIKCFFSAGWIYFFTIFNGLASELEDTELSSLARTTIVRVTVKYTSPNDPNNVCDESFGAGFVVSKDGHVLTADHLLTPPDECKEFDVLQLTGNIGGYLGNNEIPLNISSDRNAFSDVVLLKFVDTPQDHAVAPVCRSDDLIAGERLLAFGFPKNEGFSPIDVRYSNPDGTRGRWRVSSVFTYGVSGGPVYNTKGQVVAVVQGGLAGTPAVRYVVPLRQAKSLIEYGGDLPECATDRDEIPTSGEGTCDATKLTWDEYKKCRP